MAKKTTTSARGMSEEQMEKARQRTRDYVQRTGYAAQRAYLARSFMVTAALNREKDGDIIELFDEGAPVATQLKGMLRELIRLRSTVALWQKTAEILREDAADGEDR